MRHTSAPVCSAGIKSQPPRYAYATAAYNHFQLIAVTRGRLFFESGAVRQWLTPGRAAILKYGSAFRLATDREEGYSGVFFIDPIARHPLFKGEAVGLALPGSLGRLADMMQAERESPRIGSNEILLGLGTALAVMAVNAAQEHQAAPVAPADYGRACAERAREALRMALYTDDSARAALAASGLSYRQLSRYFVQRFGVSPKRWLLNLKIQEACARLTTTSVSITELAYELGFSSSQHFSARFAVQVGASPSVYRRQNAITC